MPNFRRVFEPGATYFFTVVTDGRRPLFSDGGARALLRTALRDCRARWPFEIPALVLLPDHLHCLRTLAPGHTAYPMRWAWIKRRFTSQWLQAGGEERFTSEGRRRDGRRGIWQPKYWEHTIRDERDFERHADYIHFNPVRHGLVTHPRDWPYASFPRWCREGGYPDDWGGPSGGPDEWAFATIEAE